MTETSEYPPPTFSNNETAPPAAPLFTGDDLARADMLSNSIISPYKKLQETPQSVDLRDGASSEKSTGPGISSSLAEEEQTVEPGMETGIKELYREDPRCPWDEWAPDDVGINAEAASTWKKYAFIVRREKREADQSYLALHSITIQSPLVKHRLGVLFDAYKGVNTNLKRLTFNSPFHEFFYRWDRFEKIIRDERDELALKHTNLLYKIISAEIKPHIEKAQDFLLNDVTLFEPGTQVYSYVDNQDRLYNLVNSSYEQLGRGNTVFSLSSRYIDCNGSYFGYASSSLSISKFDGIIPIPELTVLPSHLHLDIKAIRAKLSERGKKLEKLNGFHYRSYQGLYTMNGCFFRSSNKRNIDDGRIIIDANMYETHNPDHTPRLQAFDTPIPPPGGLLDDSMDDSMDAVSGCSEEYSNPFVGPAYRAMMPVPRRTGAMPRPVQSSGTTTLAEGQYELCSPTVRGYCMSAKLWARFYVENVRDIKWNEEAFRSLVLPHDYKKIVWAFVDSQLALADQFDDVVQGKGKGIIMLLSGEPGVGKTLTAESVAEEMKKPLYSMSAVELGYTAEEVEENLQKVLEISTKWGAVLLLDECDVFLEKRSTSSIERNKLVSVFLRLLEYYKGVMFLTTNRISTFDPAFESRIHLTIDYPKLDFGSRLQIWRTFVRPQSSSAQYASRITEEELERLAATDMNGRQIKNVVKTARLLATRERRELIVEDIEMVLRVKQGYPAGV